MAVNWNDINQVNAFREQLIKENNNPAEVDAYIASQTKTNTNVQQPATQLTLPEQPQPEMPVEQPKESWLKGLVAGAWEQASGMPRIVLEAGKQGLNKLNPELIAISKKIDKGEASQEEIDKFIESYNASFLSQNELNQASSGIGQGALVGAKRGAGTASFIAPNPIAAGAMSGFSQETEGPINEDTLWKTGENTIVGGVTGAVLGALGNQASKLFSKAGKVGTKLKTSALIKQLGGSPKASLGGVKLLDDMQSVGIVGNNIDDVVTSANSVLRQNSDELINGLNKAGGGKLEVTSQGLLDDLQKMLDDAPTVQKPSIQRVINDVTADLKNKNAIKITDLFKLKQRYGALGKWRPGDAFDNTTAGAYEKVYVKMNSIIDDALKATGNESFRANNKATTTAMKALRYADDLSMKAGGTPLNLYDMIAGSAGVISGGAGGGLGMIGATKILRNPTVQSKVGGILEKAGNLKMPNMTRVTNKPLTQILPNTPPVLAASAMTQDKTKAENIPVQNITQLENNVPQETTSSNKQTLTLPNGTVVTREDVFNRLLEDPKNASIYKQLIAEIDRQYQEKALSSPQVAELADMNASVTQMDDLSKFVDQYKDIMGPVSGRVRALNPYDTDAQAFQSNMMLVAQNVGRALEGGILKQEDIKKYQLILPQIWDTPEVAQRKIENVKARLQDKVKARENAFKEAGYTSGAQPQLIRLGE